MTVPRYIFNRICRPRPDYASIIRDSTPVVSFGNAFTAEAATLGLNPSRVEFLSYDGQLLAGAERRLEDLFSLGTPGVGAVDPAHAKAVLEGCNNYFHRRPYRRWFNQLEPILNQIGASYYDETACHLDLVQWATDPVWGRLSRATQQTLIAADKDFLLQQLRNENIATLLLNGRGVIDNFQSAMGLVLHPVELGTAECDRLSGKSVAFFRGSLFDRVTVLGWSTNIQSSFGVSNEMRRFIAEKVRDLVG